MKKSSDAHIRANAKWEKANYDSYMVRMDKQLSAEFMSVIQALELSKNAALKQAVIEFIDNHKSIQSR